MSVSADRWTCPNAECGRTVVVTGSQDDVRVAIAAAQRRHATGHRAALEVLARLGLPDPPTERKRPRGTRPA